MKLTTTLYTLALAASAASAAPPPVDAKVDASPDAANQEENEWCMSTGQPCWKAKRAAEAFSAIIASAPQVGGLAARNVELESSHMPGGYSFSVKRDLGELANIVAESTAEAVKYYENLQMERHFHPDSNVTMPEEDMEAEDMPEEDMPEEDMPEEDMPEEDMDAETDAEKETHEGVQKREPRRYNRWWRNGSRRVRTKNGWTWSWCTRPGQSCWKKRDVEAQADKRYCLAEGNHCDIAKRAATAVIDAVGDMNDESLPEMADGDDNQEMYGGLTKRDPRRYNRWWRNGSRRVRTKNGWTWSWCTRPGQSCWKAKRDMNAMQNVARNILESLDEQ